MIKFLGEKSIKHLINIIKEKLNTKVDKKENHRLISEAEASRLAGMEDNANKYIHPSHTAATTDFYKVEVDAEGHVSSTTKVVQKDITDLGIATKEDATYIPVEPNSDIPGLMVGTDKAKLDKINTDELVTHIKGSKESNYRSGKVEITPENLGITVINNTLDTDKKVATARTLATGRKITVSGDASTTNEVIFDGSNDVDLNLEIDGSKHTHTIDKIDNLKESLDSKLNVDMGGKVGGYPILNSERKISAENLPSYVDDVIEYPNFESFPKTDSAEGQPKPETGKIYVDTSSNKSYRWGGTQYVVIASDLALGETETTAYRGDRGKISYEHTFKKDNPHNVTKAQVELGNVDNTSDKDKPISDASQVEFDKRYTKDQIENLKVKTERGNPLVLKDTTVASLRNFKIYGKTEQIQTTGKNLLTRFVQTATYPNGTKLTLNEDGSINVEKKNGDAIGITSKLYLSKGSYTLYDGINKQHSPYFEVQISTGNKNTHLGVPAVITSNGEEATLVFYAPTNAVFNDVLYPQLELGSQATSYEPYTGGKPSPSPAYPWDIKTAGASGSIVTRIQGKNLLENVLESQIFKGTTITVNSDKSITVRDTPTEVFTKTINSNIDVRSFIGSAVSIPRTDIVGLRYYGHLFLSDKNIYNWLDSRSSGKSTMIVPEKAERLAIGIEVLTTYTDTETLYPQLELSDHATSYEPYKPVQTLTSATPNGMNGMNGVYDERDYATGKDIKRFSRIKLLSSDKWFEVAVSEGALAKGIHRYAYTNYSIKITGDTEVANMRCTHFGVDSSYHGFLGKECCSISTRNLTVFIKKATVDDFKAWLDANDVYVDVELNNPIITDIPQDEMAQFSSIQTYNPNTTISNDDGTGIQVEYISSEGLGIGHRLISLNEELDALKRNAVTLNEEQVIPSKKSFNKGIKLPNTLENNSPNKYLSVDNTGEVTHVNKGDMVVGYAEKIKTSANIGNTNKPVYVDSKGNVTPINFEVNKTVPSDADFTIHKLVTPGTSEALSDAGLMTQKDKQKLDKIGENANNYTHPSDGKNANKSSGLYKITVNDLGHVTATSAVIKKDITDLGIPSQDTTYTSSKGIVLKGKDFQHSNNITADTIGPTSNASGWAGSIVVPRIAYDAHGHITAINTQTITSPSKPNVSDLPGYSSIRQVAAGGTEGQVLKRVGSSYGWAEDNNTEYKTGTASVSGLTKLYASTGTNTDGALTQNAIKANYVNKETTAEEIIKGPKIFNETIKIDNVDGIKVHSNNKDVKVWEVVGNNTSWNSEYNFFEKYIGTGNGNSNSLKLYAGHEMGPDVLVRTILQDGTITVHTAATFEGTLTGALTGNASSATKLQNARTFTIISGSNKGTAKSFSGESNIELPLPSTITSNTTGRANTAGTADVANAVEWSKVQNKPDNILYGEKIGWYWGVVLPDGTQNSSYIRTPLYGLLPYSSTNENSNLGTTDWQFAESHVKKSYVHEKLLFNENTYIQRNSVTGGIDFICR